MCQWESRVETGTLVVYTCCMLYPCDCYGVGGPDGPVTVRLCVSGSATASNLEQESASCELAAGVKGTALCCSACVVRERLVRACRRKSGPYGLQETSATTCRNHSAIDPSKAHSSASPTHCCSTFRDVCGLPDRKGWFPSECAKRSGHWQQSGPWAGVLSCPAASVHPHPE